MARPTIFSFPVSWSLLADYPDPKLLERQMPIRTVTQPQAAAEFEEDLSQPLPISALLKTGPAGLTLASEPNPASGSDQWEMVIPKMLRPPARRTPSLPAPEKPGLPAAPAPMTFAPTITPITPPQFRLSAESRMFERHLLLLAAILIVAAVLAGGLMLFDLYATPAAPHQTIEAGAALPVGSAGWIAATDRGRRVSIDRESASLTDFRLEFQARMNGKALAWVFRAQDPQNYYAARLEVVKPGPQPQVALKRFAVIRGKDQLASQVLLPMPLRQDTIYKVRVEALGSQFSTWIMDQKLDQWVDDRLKTGGVGWYSDGGEKADNQARLDVFPLFRK